MSERVRDVYELRRCFVCGGIGALCGHREYDVEVALIEAEQRRSIRRPIKREKGKEAA
jgi:hypothetical protein